jgi:acetyltransferase
VLRVNTGMLELAQSLGFQERSDPGDPDDHQVRYVSLELQTNTEARAV